MIQCASQKSKQFQQKEQKGVILACASNWFLYYDYLKKCSKNKMPANFANIQLTSRSEDFKNHLKSILNEKLPAVRFCVGDKDAALANAFSSKF